MVDGAMPIQLPPTSRNSSNSRNSLQIDADNLDALVQRTEELLRQYDILRHQENNFEKLLAVEKELANIRQQSRNLSYDQFNLYPKLEDEDFGSKLALKKEYFKSKYVEYKDITREQYEKYGNAVCATKGSTFRLSQNQIFLKNFLNPKTPYNSILLFHGVGVGKCHGRGTKILMWSGEIKEVQNILNGEYLMGDDGLPREVVSLARGKDMLYKVKGGDIEWTGNSEHILCLKYFGQNIYYEPETRLWLMETIHPDSLKTVIAGSKSREEIENIRNLQQEHMVYEIPIKDFINLDEQTREGFKAFRVPIQSEGKEPNNTLVSNAYDMGGRAIIDSELVKHLLKQPIWFREAWVSGYIEANSITKQNGICLLSGDDNTDSIALLLRSIGYKVTIHSDNYIEVNTDILSDFSYDITVEPYKEDEYFGFVITGNHRYLLEDLTVTHNTCTAVTIAENFHSQYKNKTLILLPSSIKDNFRRQIFDVNKLSSVTDSGESQCIAHRYLKLLPDRKGIDKEVLEKRVNKLINDSYELMGFMEFGNLIQNMEESLKTRYNGNPKQVEAAMRLKLREQFSNRVIIVDEVHNTRAEKADTKKKVPPLLMKTLEAAQNVKLILCTATPMFNTADEIVWILNYMRANEKLPLLPLEKGKLFKADGTLANPRELAKACRGMVSFMRGDNPFTFPLRLYPSFNDDKQCIRSSPTLDIKGNELPESKRLKSKEIIISVMSKLQADSYKEVKKQKANETEDLDEFDPDENFELDETKSHLSKPIQISNIVYPNPKRNPESEVYGKKGFLDCFKNTGKNTYKFQYKTGLDLKNFLSYENIGEYSAKLKTIVDYIKKSKGIVFVYSSYIWSALLPLAITLEHMGLTRHGTDNLLDGITEKGTHLQGKYSLLVADKMFGVDINKEVKAITDPNNKNGEKIKVILANSVVAEGIDFKCIREVHIVEPWYHQNKSEQIIGRAVRTCSHTSLPIHERNVTIYQHAAVVDTETKQESIDLQIYRVAEQKQEAINAVQQILRDNSIDCQLNKGVSYFDPKVFNFKSKVESSQGKTVLKYGWGDATDQFKTNCKILEDGGKDDSTFSTEMYLDDVGYYSDFIMALFRKLDGTIDYTKSLTYEEIRNGVGLLLSNMDEDILKFTLNALLNAGKSREYLAFVGRKYIMMPAAETFGYVTMKERQNYKQLQLERLMIKNTGIANAEDPTPQDQNNQDNDEDLQNAQDHVHRPIDFDIMQIIDEETKKCKERLTDDYPRVLELPILDYVIDRLNARQLEALFVHKDLLTYRLVASTRPSIKASLERAGAMLELEPGKYIFRTPFNRSAWLLRSEGNELNLEDVPPAKLQNHNIKVHNIYNEHNHKEHFCFLEYNKKHGYQFKLINSKKTHSTGCDCARTPTNTRDDLIKRISDMGYNYEDLSFKKQDSNKDDLCFILELVTREYDHRMSKQDKNYHSQLKRPLHYKDFDYLSKKQKAKDKEADEENKNIPKKRGRKPKAVAAEN